MIKKVTILAVLIILCLGVFAGCGEDERNDLFEFPSRLHS